MLKVAKNDGDKDGDLIMANADLEIIKSLSQAAGNLYDGAVDDKGEPLKMGLAREELPITDRKYIDGGKVRFAGDQVVVTYQAQIPLSDVHQNGINGFQNKMNDMVQNLVKQLKKNYKSITGKGVTLTALGDDTSVKVDYVSRSRTLVTAHRNYKIGGLSEVISASEDDTKERAISDTYRKFLEQGGFGKRPKNDTRPKNA